eukprot:6208907-Pleurochrysis_carterae.AAC.3
MAKKSVIGASECIFRTLEIACDGVEMGKGRPEIAYARAGTKTYHVSKTWQNRMRVSRSRRGQVQRGIDRTKEDGLKRPSCMCEAALDPEVTKDARTTKAGMRTCARTRQQNHRCSLESHLLLFCLLTLLWLLAPLLVPTLRSVHQWALS